MVFLLWLLGFAGVAGTIAMFVANQTKALQIRGQSISNNPRIIELEWIQKWNGALPTYMMGSGQGVMIDLRK